MAVAMGENQEGIWKPKLSNSMTVPNTKIEYIAPFFKKGYLFILSILEIVNCLTTKAPMPLPSKIKGTDKVKANAPITPSMENDASITSR